MVDFYGKSVGKYTISHGFYGLDNCLMLQKSGDHRLRLVVEIPGNLPGILPPRWFSRRISAPERWPSSSICRASEKKKKLDVKVDVFQTNPQNTEFLEHIIEIVEMLFLIDFLKKTVEIFLSKNQILNKPS